MGGSGGSGGREVTSAGHCIVVASAIGFSYLPLLAKGQAQAHGTRTDRWASVTFTAVPRSRSSADASVPRREWCAATTGSAGGGEFAFDLQSSVVVLATSVAVHLSIRAHTRRVGIFAQQVVRAVAQPQQELAIRRVGVWIESSGKSIAKKLFWRRVCNAVPV